LSENGFTTNEEEYNKALEHQKEMGRQANKQELGDWVELSEGDTEFVGYDALTCDTKVLRYRKVNQKGKGNQQFDLTMTLGFELGYEFKLSSGSSIGVGAFLNYGVYSMYSNKPLGSAIDLTAPSKQEDKNAVVNVESLTNAYTEKMGHLDAGVKVSFNMDFIK
jgi:hypothetical protein